MVKQEQKVKTLAIIPFFLSKIFSELGGNRLLTEAAI